MKPTSQGLQYKDIFFIRLTACFQQWWMGSWSFPQDKNGSYRFDQEITGEKEGEKQRVRDQKQRWQNNWIVVDNNLLWRSKAYTFRHFVCNLSGNSTHVQDTSCPLSDWCLLPNGVRDLLLHDSLIIFKYWSEWDKLHCDLFNSSLQSRHLPKYLPFSTWLNLPRTKLIPIHA